MDYFIDCCVRISDKSQFRLLNHEMQKKVNVVEEDVPSFSEPTASCHEETLRRCINVLSIKGSILVEVLLSQ